MIAGPLHDLGEMYIAPEFGEAEADRELDALAYRQLVVHPHVGPLLVAQLTNYPGAVARAVAEHHERLDGSGYPHRLTGDRIRCSAAWSRSPMRRWPSCAARTRRCSAPAWRCARCRANSIWPGSVTRDSAAGDEPALTPVMEPADIRARRAASARCCRRPRTTSRCSASASVRWRCVRRSTWPPSSSRGCASAGTRAGCGTRQAASGRGRRRGRGGRRRALFPPARHPAPCWIGAGELPAEEAATLAALCDSLPMGRMADPPRRGYSSPCRSSRR